VLEVTDSAATMIRDLVHEAELAAGGLRIAQRDDHPALTMRLTGVAEPDDVVLTQHDATVFLGPIRRPTPGRADVGRPSGRRWHELLPRGLSRCDGSLIIRSIEGAAPPDQPDDHRSF